MLDDVNILITGGTGSFGKKFTEIVLNNYEPRRFIIFSRDELKQHEMRQWFSEEKYPCIRYFIGDVRDRDRLYRAFDGVDIVIHAAALKQVPTAEYNPLEAIKTNILGAANIIDTAIDRGIEKVVALSTDKAVNPINLYGATKLCSDKLFVSGNSYVGKHSTRFSLVRYGNVIGSRGSVIPLFLKMRESGRLPITDKRMTRFWISLEQGVKLVIKCLEKMEGGEIFVPKIPSMKITELAEAIAPESEWDIIGIRPGEKLHEVLIPEDEARNTLEYDDYYVILPQFHEWNSQTYQNKNGGKPCPDEFCYTSSQNSEWLNKDSIKRLISLG